MGVHFDVFRTAPTGNHFGVQTVSKIQNLLFALLQVGPGFGHMFNTNDLHLTD